MTENNRELIKQGRREVAEDRRIAGLMNQDENRQAMTQRADVTEQLCDTLTTATAQIEAISALADRWEARGRSDIETADSSRDDFDSVRDEGYAFISRALHIRSVLEETSPAHPASVIDGQPTGDAKPLHTEEPSPGRLVVGEPGLGTSFSPQEENHR